MTDKYDELADGYKNQTILGLKFIRKKKTV